MMIMRLNVQNITVTEGTLGREFRLKNTKGNKNIFK